MAHFLFLGQHWINLDKIISVSFRPDPKSGKEFCQIDYGSLAAKLSLGEEDSKKLTEYLRKHSDEA